MFTAKTRALQLPHGAKYPGAGCSFALRHRYQNGTGSVAEPTRQKGLHANSEHVVALGIGSERLRSPSVGAFPDRCSWAMRTVNRSRNLSVLNSCPSRCALSLRNSLTKCGMHNSEMDVVQRIVQQDINSAI